MIDVVDAGENSGTTCFFARAILCKNCVRLSFPVESKGAFQTSWLFWEHTYI
jgi:hypothetical protein